MHALAECSLTWNNFHSLLMGCCHFHRCQNNPGFLKGQFVPFQCHCISSLCREHDDLADTPADGSNLDWAEERLKGGLWLVMWIWRHNASGLSHPETHSAMAVDYRSHGAKANLASRVQNILLSEWQLNETCTWRKHSQLDARKPVWRYSSAKHQLWDPQAPIISSAFAEEALTSFSKCMMERENGWGFQMLGQCRG